MIIQSSPLGNILCLKRNLQTTTSHAKSHGIHVNMVWFRRCKSIFVFRIDIPVKGDGGVVEGTRGVDVVEDGDVHGYFSATTGTDVGC